MTLTVATPEDLLLDDLPPSPPPPPVVVLVAVAVDACCGVASHAPVMTVPLLTYAPPSLTMYPSGVVVPARMTPSDPK